MTSTGAASEVSGELASVLAAFRARASSDATSTFLSTLDGGRWSYGQLADHVHAVASDIARAATSPVVGAYGGNDPLSVVSLLATWEAGRALACGGRQVPADAARPLFEMVNCATILAAEVAPFEGGPWQTIRLSAPQSVPENATRRTPSTARPTRSADLAAICFTSGTTGKPKAIKLTHRHLVEQVARMIAVPGKPSGFRPRVSAARPLVSFSPFGHNGFFSWLGMALWLGRGLVLVDKFSVEAAVAAVAEFSPSTLALTPTMIQMLATADGDLEFPGVKYVTSSTAPLPADVKEQFTHRFGVPILQAYGMTELGNVAKEHLEDVLAGRQPRGSVGRVSPGREVRIVGDDGEPVTPGEEGRLLVRVTDHAPPPSQVPVDAEGWFDTGDRGALTSDGILIVSGRTSDRIIVGGFNVTPAEVESEIRRTGLVVDAVVVGLPDSRLGEVPVVGVVWNREERPEELLGAIRDKLAHYKLPRQVFTVSEIPRTAYGKVDRRKAAAQARQELANQKARVAHAGD